MESYGPVKEVPQVAKILSVDHLRTTKSENSTPFNKKRREKMMIPISVIMRQNSQSLSQNTVFQSCHHRSWSHDLILNHRMAYVIKTYTNPYHKTTTSRNFRVIGGFSLATAYPPYPGMRWRFSGAAICNSAHHTSPGGPIVLQRTVIASLPAPGHRAAVRSIDGAFATPAKIRSLREETALCAGKPDYGWLYVYCSCLTVEWECKQLCCI